MRRYFWVFRVALTILGGCTTIRKYIDKIIESRPPREGEAVSLSRPPRPAFPLPGGDPQWPS